ncbi:hypothetical protein CATMQ487_14460 [Sphaerotilus microaerophilus]|uniref:Uncharacterized protein n=1 Tax=Sphaerotilus microaerophilus TaxID=2914710 RepID=A0ABN6PHK4_9BURK|nr:hypothetical protein CATMQ487_14460 [Sphaerotilus sp. FB-5]
MARRKVATKQIKDLARLVSNFGDLVTHRFALHVHRAAAVALRRGHTVLDTVHLRLGQQRPVRAGVALLGTALALAGAALGAVTATRSIRRRRLR